MKQVKQVLKELMISSILWTAIVTLLFVIISRGRVSMLFGGLFGGAAALVLLWHMFRHLDIALDMDPAHASRHAQLASLQRLVIMAVTLAVCMIFYEYVHPIPAILTLFESRSVHYRIRKCTRVMKNYLKNRYVLQIFCCFIL